MWDVLREKTEKSTIDSTSLNTAVSTKRDKALGLMLLGFVFSWSFDLIKTAIELLKLPNQFSFEF